MSGQFDCCMGFCAAMCATSDVVHRAPGLALGPSKVRAIPTRFDSRSNGVWPFNTFSDAGRPETVEGLAAGLMPGRSCDAAAEGSAAASGLVPRRSCDAAVEGSAAASCDLPEIRAVFSAVVQCRELLNPITMQHEIRTASQILGTFTMPTRT